MTNNEAKLIRQTLKGFVDAGLISAGTVDEMLDPASNGAGKAQRPDLMTRRGVAALLQCTTRSLINYEKSGNLRPVKIAGKRLVRYHFEDVQSLLQAGQVLK